ncbi:hypothetical protein [Clostridium hydrogenum]|uniref:hypothetical protein n=1 Tax=Clostridium hydrogenum TaxID=2855764 RepID=UPI001F3209E2|nr:hypothetical protein [Clostridium hydrogenum]
MKFNRWKSQDDYSYAFRLFNKYHTYMNSLYWSYVPAYDSAQYTYRNAIKKVPNNTTHKVFHLSGKNSDRVVSNINEWSKNLKEFDNWTRLNSLVAVNAYFEIYLSSVISLAIESDLGLLYCFSKEFDGIKVLKYGNQEKYSFYDKSEEITKGTWPKRISNYKQIFGKVPVELEKHEGDLEKIRKIRNDVTHSFGRDIELSRSRDTKRIIDIERISTERLQKYMGIIREVARGIDKHLLNNHIGDYENIYYYHICKDKLILQNPTQDFKKKLNSLYVKNKGWDYINSLIDYYKKL